MRFLFAPLSIVAGILAGLVGKRVFDFAWGLVDEEEAPTSKHRDVTWPKLLAAGALQGAVFRVVKSVADRGLRKGFYNVTGSWPGEKKPDAK